MKKNNYLSNKDLLPEIMKYKETGVPSEKFGEMLLKIATNLSNKPNFIKYTWRDDMISSAVLTCLKYSKNFDPDKQERPNPFAYITTICYNAFQAYLNNQKKHKQIKHECYNKQYLVDEGDAWYSIDYTELKKWDEIDNKDQ